MNYSEIRNRIATGCTYLPKLLLAAIESLDFRMTAKINTLNEKAELLELKNKELLEYTKYLSKELDDLISYTIKLDQRIIDLENKPVDLISRQAVWSDVMRVF